MLSYLKYDDKTDSFIFPGAVNKEIFKQFMEEVVLQEVKSGDIIIMDNLNVHKNSYNKDLFQRKRVEIKDMPSYSPEFNPIEMMWSKVKTHVRKAEPRTLNDVLREVSIAHLDVTADDAKGWYVASGYCQ